MLHDSEGFIHVEFAAVQNAIKESNGICLILRSQQ